MNLAMLTPWQQLLWLVCAAILIVPIITAGVSSAVHGYFRAKEQHIAKIAKAVGEVAKNIQEDISKKVGAETAKKEQELRRAAERLDIWIKDHTKTEESEKKEKD